MVENKVNQFTAARTPYEPGLHKALHVGGYANPTMKRHALWALTLFVLLALLELFFSIRTDFFSSKGIDDYLQRLLFKLVFVLLVFFSLLGNYQIARHVRFPLYRTVFWSILILVEFFWGAPIDGEPSMLLYLTNEGLFSSYKSVVDILTSNNCIGCSLFLDTVLPGILLFGLFEVLIIWLSGTISERVFQKAIPV